MHFCIYIIYSRQSQFIFYIFRALRMSVSKTTASSNKELESNLKINAQVALQNRQYSKAIQLYSKAIVFNPLDEKLLQGRALAYNKNQKFKESLKDALQCISVNPKCWLGYELALEVVIETDSIKQCQYLLQKVEKNDKKNQHPIKFKQKLKILTDLKLTLQNTIISNFMDWLGNSKASFRKIAICQQSSFYRSVRVKKKILNKEVIIFIPKSELITIEMAKQNPTIIKLHTQKIQLCSPKHCILSIYLLNLKMDSNNKFKHYIQLLPKEYPTFPIFYNRKQLEQLKGSYFLEQIMQKMTDLKKDYAAICNCDPQNFTFTYQQFCWARMTVCSRIFGVNIHGLKTDALVPLADMLNHRAPKQTLWYYSDVYDGFTIQSLQDIQVGEEIFDSYGKKCNSRFLLHYGFVLENNQSNEVSIVIQATEKDSLLPEKLAMIGRNNIGTFSFRITKHFYDRSANQLLGTLRFMMIDTQEDLQILSESLEEQTQYFRINRTPFINIENQLKTWTTFDQILRSTLNGYTTTIAEDEVLLTKPLTTNLKNCIILRKGEKQILQYWIECSEKIKNILLCKKKEAKKRMKKAEYKQFSRYLIQIIN